MKTWLVVILLLGVADGACAQETSVVAAVRESGTVNAEALPATSWGIAPSSFFSSSNTHDFFLVPALRLSFTEAAVPEFTAATMAVPMASPVPARKHHTTSGVDNYRLQIAMGFTYVRFRSAAFDAGMYGLNTAVVYFLNPRLGVEGNFTAAFGRNVFRPTNDQTRYAGIMGGPKIAWRKPEWEPWVHVLAGLAHVNPQLADVSKNGLAIQAGGGVDFPVFDELFWLRVEGDYVRSQLYNTGQNNFQAVVGVVFHFF